MLIMQVSRRLVSHVVQVSSYCRRVALKTQIMAMNESCWSHCYSTDSISPPHIDGTEKQFQPNIVQLVEDISKLNLIEVADLNELLKKTLNIQDAPMMAMGMAAAASPQDEDEDITPKKEKVIFSVKLTKYDESKKIQLIKAIKGLVPNLNLVQAKKFVESIPQLVKADIPKEDAEKLKGALEAAGGVADIE